MRVFWRTLVSVFTNRTHSVLLYCTADSDRGEEKGRWAAAEHTIEIPPLSRNPQCRQYSNFKRVIPPGISIQISIIVWVFKAIINVAFGLVWIPISAYVV